MNSPSQDIKDFLELSSTATGLVFGTDLFVGQEPDGAGVADKVVTIFDSTGGQAATNFTLKNPSFMVKIRGNKFGYTEGYTLAELIFDALHAQKNITINSTRYIQIIATTDINYLGQDKNNRPIWTINFSILRTA